MTIHDQVQSILKHDKASRNSDKRLLVVYLQKAGMQLTEAQIALFMQLPSMETLRRTRQQIQMKGEYEADPQVNEARFEKYKQVRENITIEDPEKLLESQGIKVFPYQQG